MDGNSKLFVLPTFLFNMLFSFFILPLSPSYILIFLSLKKCQLFNNLEMLSQFSCVIENNGEVVLWTLK